MGKTTTSIKINPDLLKEAKHYAIDNDLTFSELFESALKREAKEELGVEIKIEKILFSWKKIINPKHQVILIAYQCSLKDPEAKFTLTPDDDQYHWFSFDELEKYFPAGDQQYRQAILKYYQLK